MTDTVEERDKVVGRVGESVYTHLSLDESVPPYIYITSVGYYQQLYDMDVHKNGFHIIRRASVFTATVAACVYYAFKYHNMPRTPQEVCGMFGISRQMLSKGCHHCAVIDTLPLRGDTAELLFLRFANQLGIPYPNVRYAIDRLYTPIKPLINRYKPAAIAGGLICVLLDIHQHDSSSTILHRLTLKEVCVHVGVCTSIVRAIKQVIFTNSSVRVTDGVETSSGDDEFERMFAEHFPTPAVSDGS